MREDFRDRGGMQLIVESDNSIDPFLKWAGGKRWLVKRSKKIVPSHYQRYIEPFVGSGAIFFSLPVSPFIIADANQDLINCYEAVKSNYTKVESLLRLHQRKHCDDYYYKVRQSRPRLLHARAARFIYLNRTCWNGLYRVNLKGEFNVPRGTKNNVLLESDDFERVSERLKSGTILCSDFQDTLAMARDGDFVFIDPPYTVKHNMNGFLKYNEKIFSWEDQERLQKAVASAVNRGAMVTMTNADHESIHNLYSGMCKIEKLKRHSVIAGASINRGVISEVLLRIGWNE